MREVRHLVVVLGDQLDRGASAWDGFDVARDAAWMAEVRDESTHVWSSKPRIALFLAAMRHFAADLRAEGVRLTYEALREGSLADALAEAIATLRPRKVILTWPGDHRVLTALQAAAGDLLEVREDRHFLCSRAEFAAFAAGKSALRMEHFYRGLRRRLGVLMEDGEPVGGQWNFDHDNRSSFGKKGPGLVPPPARFAPDAITGEVITLVRAAFADHPGDLDRFAWPVTRADARAALDRFIRERLRDFGRWQDAMWEGEPWLFHAHLAAAMNLRLLDPREVIAAAEQAWRDGRAPLASVEGFIRQILGWREYVRGIYWLYMPDYADRNDLGADRDLPAWYWTGDTPMRCLSGVIRQTLEHGYAHHIQRLMVTGLYALLHGVEPRQVHAWYLSVYVDAVEWVELPNTLGMSQYADGGLLASKPYVATGKYIDRMSNACGGCRFDPDVRTGPRACPFTVLYWDFLARHAPRLRANARMALQMKNLDRIPQDELAAIRALAATLRAR